MKKWLLPIMAAVMAFSSCQKSEPIVQNVLPKEACYGPANANRTATAGLSEGFETGSKTSYTSASVTLLSGSWTLSDALIGTLSTDRKNGLASARIQNTGKLSMNFDLLSGASTVSFNYGVFSSDGSSSFELWASTNSGTTWSKIGSTITASSTSLTNASFTVNLSGAVRFEIRKTAGGTNRLNIDDIVITSNNNTAPTRDNNMGMGNPSNATTSTSNTTNYLMDKGMYTLSYNSTSGIPNWVSWHLSTAWKGSAPRSTSFTSDNTLPTGWYRVTTSDYTNTGFDRGHMCPSEDRDFSSAENQVTFTMTNVIPQAPTCNQQTWRLLEEYCRTLMTAGNELYIISGGRGTGGSGSNGGTTSSIAGGLVKVPARVWKVIVVLPTGSNDASRVSTATRVIAVDMPNTQSINSTNWGMYRVSVDFLESQLGYDFLSNVPTSIQSVIEASVDSGPTL
jgi:endonuclease G